MAECLTEVGKQQYKNTFLGTVTDELKKAGIVGPLAGAAAGRIVENWITDPDESMPFLWIGGALLGTRQVRGRVKGFVSSKNTPKLPNSPDRDMDETLRAAMDAEKVSGAANVTGGVLDMQKDATLLSMIQTTLVSMRDSTGNALELFRNSGAMKSIGSFLETLPQTPQLVRFKEWMRGKDAYVKKLRAQVNDQFNAKYGRNAYANYHDKELLNRVVELRPDNLSEARPESLRDNLVTIAAKTNARIEDGRLVMDEFGDAIQVLDSTPGMRRMMETLVADEKFTDLIASTKAALENVKEIHLREIDRRIETARATTQSRNRGMLDDILNRNVTSEDYRQMLGSADARRHFDDALQHDAQFKRAIDFHNDKFRFNEENYWPQVYSRSAVGDLKESLHKEGLARARRDNQARVERGEAPLNEIQMEEAADNYVIRRMFEQLYEANKNNPKIKNRLLFYDETSKSVQDRQFASLAEARNVFARKISTLKISDAQKETIMNNLDNYIRSFDAKKMDGTTQKMYRVHMDDEVISNLGFNPMAQMNEQQLMKGVQQYVNGVTVANSNFLDLPRIFQLPMQWTERNLNRQMDTYFTDAGRRVYNSINDIFDKEELYANYLNDITASMRNYDKPYRELAVRQVEAAYNLVNNMYNKTGKELAQSQRNQKAADIVTYSFFTRYFTSISGYNFFEPLVVGPLLTGIRTFGNVFSGAFSKKGRERIEAVESFLKERMIIDNSLRSVQPGMDVMKATSNPHNFLDLAHGTMNNLANFFANFAAIGDSVRWLTKGRIDVERGGVMRMGFGSFMSSNNWNTAMIVTSAFEKAHKLARAYNEIKALPAGQRQIRLDGRKYSLGDLQREFRLLGVPESKIDDFATRASAYRESLDIVYDQSRSLSDIDKTLSDYLMNIAQATKDNFHGTSAVDRPHLWHTPTGRVLSMYSSYANNFGLQNLQRRIRLPLREWNVNHGDRLNIRGTSLEHLFHFKMGNFDKLRALGFDNAAIDEFPLQAYSQVTRLMFAMGVSVGGFTTRAVIDDLMAFPIREANDQEQWLRTRRAMIVNPLAPPSERKTWSDLQDEFEVLDALNVMMGSLSLAAQGAAFGRYSDIISSNYFIRQDGIMALTPVTSEVNQWFKSAAGMIQTAGTNPGNLPNEVGRQLLNTGTNWLPYVGAWPFSGFTNAALNWEVQQGRVRGAQLNGMSINIQDISL